MTAMQHPSAPPADDEGEIVPDVDEPWLPSIMNQEVGLPALGVAAGVGLLAWHLNAGRGPLLAALIGLFAAVLVLLAVVDMRTRRLPNAVVLPMYAALLAGTGAAAALGQLGPQEAWTAVVCMGATWALLWLIALFTGGLGYGDVKLGGVMALVLGWDSPYAAALGALILPMILGGFVAVPMFMLGRGGKEVPFGPFMAAGALLVLLLPGVIVRAATGGFS
jgi:leader peptidase (prepilin peptidase)/N-methyltransferase